MAEKKNWVVTTSGDQPLSDVKKKLTEAGFAIDQELDEIGAITGSAADEVAERLRSVPGVADVSPDSPIDIGPPDAPVTW
jgi:hypothetical protein